MSHTDDEARAAARPGPAAGSGTGPGLTRRAFVGGLAGMAGAAGLGLSACSSGLKDGTNTATKTIKIGFISPMTWGIESNVIERFAGAGVPAEKISFVRDTFTFNFPSAPSALVDEFRKYYGPTMNAFEAAEKNGRAADLQKELEDLFNSQNKSPSKDTTSIPATFLRVTVAL